MSLPLSCVLLDDEAYAMENLYECISQSPDFEIVGTATSVEDAFRLVVQSQPQTAFMDIRLKGGSVYSLFDRLAKAGIGIPATVLVSGFPADAVEALKHYNQYIHYFIEKPFLDNWEAQFQPAFDKLIAHLCVMPALKPDRDYTFIKSGEFLERVPTREVAWAEVIPGGKCCLVTDQQQYEVNMPLKQLIVKYPETRLISCTREYAINRNRVMRVDFTHREVYIKYRDSEKPFEIGKSYFNDLIDGLKVE